jgi:hypothetical protein
MPFLSVGRLAALLCVVGLVLAGAGLFMGNAVGTLLLLVGVAALGGSAWLINDLRARLAGRLQELAQKQAQAKAGAKA